MSPSANPSAEPPPNRPADAAAALEELRAGNQRWRQDHPRRPRQNDVVRRQLVGGQHPFATVVGCVDSRVPSELVFDQGLGDLLNVRTAGQMLDQAVLLSATFGVVSLGTPLVVVLGHSGCGAVSAAVEAIDSDASPPSWLAPFVEHLRPVLAHTDETGEPQARQDAAVTANVRGVVERLSVEPAIAARIAEGAVRVVGARYELETGVVTFCP